MKNLNIWKLKFYPARCVWSNIKLFFRKIKWSHQRIVRGFCDYDVWDLDSTYYAYIAATLKHLAKHHHGVPVSFCPDGKDVDECDKQWTDFLNKLSSSFEEIEFTKDEYEFDSSMFEFREKTFNDFIKHIDSYWD